MFKHFCSVKIILFPKNRKKTKKEKSKISEPENHLNIICGQDIYIQRKISVPKFVFNQITKPKTEKPFIAVNLPVIPTFFFPIH